jgi:hypothetical protein
MGRITAPHTRSPARVAHALCQPGACSPQCSTAPRPTNSGVLRRGVQACCHKWSTGKLGQPRHLLSRHFRAPAVPASIEAPAATQIPCTSSACLPIEPATASVVALPRPCMHLNFSRSHPPPKSLLECRQSGAATSIQAAWRSHAARQKLGLTLRTLNHRAALCIQRAWRSRLFLLHCRCLDAASLLMDALASVTLLPALCLTLLSTRMLGLAAQRASNCLPLQRLQWSYLSSGGGALQAAGLCATLYAAVVHCRLH